MSEVSGALENREQRLTSEMSALLSSGRPRTCSQRAQRCKVAGCDTSWERPRGSGTSARNVASEECQGCSTTAVKGEDVVLGAGPNTEMSTTVPLRTETVLQSLVIQEDLDLPISLFYKEATHPKSQCF